MVHIARCCESLRLCRQHSAPAVLSAAEANERKAQKATDGGF